MNALNEMNHNLQASRDENQHQLQNALRQQSEQFSLQLQQLLQAQRQVFDSEIGSLRAQINQPVQDPESMVPEHYSPSSAAAKVIKIPDPASFSGNRDDLPRWLAQVKVKLSVNAVHFPDNESRVGYLFSRLEGAAAQQLLPYFNSASGLASIPSTDSFYQILENAFGHPDRKTWAQNKLESLYQRNKEFAVHYAEFQRVAVDCQYDDEALRSRLRRSLSQELQFALALVPEHEISSYTALILRCQQLDNNLRAVSQNASRPRLPGAQSLSPANNVPAVRPTAPVPRPAPAPSGPEPMQLDSTGPKGRLTDAERQRRQQHNLCLYCGQPGHFRTNCPQRRRPAAGNLSALSALVPSSSSPSSASSHPPVPPVSSDSSTSPSHVSFADTPTVIPGN